MASDSDLLPADQQKRHWTDFLIPLGATVFGVFVVRIWQAQYPKFFSENVWILPASIAVVAACWIIPFLLHHRTRRIYKRVVAIPRFGKLLFCLLCIVVLVGIVVGFIVLLRFHSRHLHNLIAASAPATSTTTAPATTSTSGTPQSAPAHPTTASMGIHKQPQPAASRSPCFARLPIFQRPIQAPPGFGYAVEVTLRSKVAKNTEIRIFASAAMDGYAGDVTATAHGRSFRGESGELIVLSSDKLPVMQFYSQYRFTIKCIDKLPVADAPAAITQVPIAQAPALQQPVTGAQQDDCQRLGPHLNFVDLSKVEEGHDWEKPIAGQLYWKKYYTIPVQPNTHVLHFDWKNLFVNIQYKEPDPKPNVVALPEGVFFGGETASTKASNQWEIRFENSQPAPSKITIWVSAGHKFVFSDGLCLFPVTPKGSQ